MRRMTLTAFATTTVVALFSIPSAHAQVRLVNGEIVRPAPFPGAGPQAQQIDYQPKKVVIDPKQLAGSPQAMGGGGQPMMLPPQAGYPYLNAPLNPVPVPNVPYQVGGTYYTNPAFAPHEMLYSHSYRAMYPPFYYRAKGFWIGGPHKRLTHDNWELKGTTVDVDYRSSAPLM